MATYLDNSKTNVTGFSAIPSTPVSTTPTPDPTIAQTPAEQQQYLVDTNLYSNYAGGEYTGALNFIDLINKRGRYIEATSQPYKDALFSMMSYGNPQLEQNYFNSAIPQIQNSYNQAMDMSNRFAGATGTNIDSTEQKLADRLNALKQEETIAGTAKVIKQRLKERDLMTSLGYSSAQNQVIADKV